MLSDKFMKLLNDIQETVLAGDNLRMAYADNMYSFDCGSNCSGDCSGSCYDTCYGDCSGDCAGTCETMCDRTMN